MTARELAVSLQLMSQGLRVMTGYWIDEAEKQIEAHDAEVRDHGLSASDLACSDGGLYASHSAKMEYSKGFDDGRKYGLLENSSRAVGDMQEAAKQDFSAPELDKTFPQMVPNGEDVRKWQVRLYWPTDDNSFNKFSCIVDDIGYADRIISVSCPEAEALADAGNAFKAVKAELAKWNDLADKARRPDAFYADYNEGTMRAMQALLASSEAEARAKTVPMAMLKEIYRVFSSPGWTPENGNTISSIAARYGYKVEEDTP